MTEIFISFTYKLLSLLMSVYAMFGTAVTPGTDDPISSADPGNTVCTAVFWGDTQVSDYMLSRQPYVEAACRDVDASAEKIDALIVAGDIAENGKGSEYRLMQDNFSLISTVDSYLLASGNHDVRLRSYKLTDGSFRDFISAVDPAHPVDRMWYSRDINGIKFIVLGTAKTEFEEAYLSEEELSWLDSELEQATEGGAPAFVICHQPLKLTHGLPDTWGSPVNSAGSIGDQSERVGEILTKYKNVFFLTGHLHTGFGEYTFEELGGVHLVNVPSLGIKNKDGLADRGTGFMIEVCRDKVLFRARNFAKGVYLPEFDAEYTLE